MKALILGLSFSLVASSFVFAMPALVNSLARRSLEEPVLPRAAHTDPRPLITPSLPPVLPPNEAAGLPRVPPDRGRSEGQGRGEEARGGRGRGDEASSKGARNRNKRNQKNGAKPPQASNQPPAPSAGPGRSSGPKAGGPGNGPPGRAGSGTDDSVSASSSGPKRGKPTGKGRAKGRRPSSLRGTPPRHAKARSH